MISREQLVAKLAKQGHARAAMSTCMTCWQTAHRWRPWAEDPTEGIAREVYNGQGSDQLRAELWALAALVDAHRDEFDGYLQGLEQAPRLADRRQAHRRR